MPHQTVHGKDHDYRNSMLASSSGCIFNGGRFTTVKNIYLSDRTTDRQGMLILGLRLSIRQLTALNIVLGVLYEKLNPDAQLFHNSKRYDRRLDPPWLHSTEDKCDIAKLTQPGCPEWPLVRRNFHHPIRRPSRHVALYVSRQLSNEKRLIASIIVPLTRNMRPYDTYRIISTLAYQISRNMPSSAGHILRAIEENPCIFELDSNTQMNELIVTPLLLASTQATIEEKMGWPSVIVIDSFAHQLTDNSILDQITATLLDLSLNLSIHDIKLSIVITSSTTLLDRAAKGITMLQYYTAIRRGGIVWAYCYFSGRVADALTNFGPVWPERSWKESLLLRPLTSHNRVSHFTLQISSLGRGLALKLVRRQTHAAGVSGSCND